MLKLELPMKILSRNVLDRQHWAVKRKEKQHWCLLVRNQMRLNKVRFTKEKEKHSIEIISYRSRKLDYDNLVGGCKQLIDAMIEEGYIWDDSPKYLDLRIKQVKNSDPVRQKLTKFHNKTWIARY